MQEEVENKAVTLVISSARLTAKVLRNAIAKYLAYAKQQKRAAEAEKNAPVPEVVPHGKQTVKELVAQNQGVVNIEVADKSLKPFEKIARKYGVDYAVTKDKSGEKPKYMVFFKARDSDAMTAAFQEFTAKSLKKSRPSVIQKLHDLLARSKAEDRTPVQHKEQER